MRFSKKALALLVLGLCVSQYSAAKVEASAYTQYAINGSEIRLTETTSSEITNLKTKLKTKPNDPDLLYELANAYSKAGDNNFAIIYYKKTIIADSSYAEAFYGMGSSYQKKNNYNESIKAFQNGLFAAKSSKHKKDFDINAYNLKTYLKLADVYAKMNNKYETKRWLKEALNLSPNDERVQYNLQNYKNYRYAQD